MTAVDLSPLKALAGPDGWSDDPDRLAPKLVEWRDRWRGTTPLLLLPRTTAEVAALVGWCAAQRVAITPQGGNTGLVGGQIPDGEVLLSLEKMTAVREVSPLDDVMIVEAGLPLVTAQETAAAAGRFFPLSLASEGTATIGGLISTNAGGVAVLPDGSVFHGLKRLRKDNTGYDLKQLLIGAEGTLGVVTAAALKLFPALRSRATALVGLDSPAAALELLARAKHDSGGGVEAFELISAPGMGFAERHLPGCRNPLSPVHAWYVLIEIASSEDGHAEVALARILEQALDSDLIADAALAQSQTQRHDFWRLREGQSAAQKPEGTAWKHDVSVPVARVPEFMATATAAVEAFAPGVRVCAFGHVGDGNIHFDVLQPVGGDGAAHSALRDAGSRIVHDIAAGMGGSISAEHGLGTMKTAEALRYKDPVAVAAMQAVRGALDPVRIMNPRVLF